MQKVVSLSSLLPNPHRNIDKYPINEDKITELQQSYDTTGYWGNIIARPAPGKRGKYEIAFGHHRLEALRRRKQSKVEVIIKDLNEVMMIQMMANENSETYGTRADVEQESLKSLIQAIADDTDGSVREAIASHIPRKGNPQWFIAPSVLPPKVEYTSREAYITAGGYTKLSLAKVLGWVRKDGQACRPSAQFEIAWSALELLEGTDLVTEKDFIGLTRNQAQLLEEETAKAHKTWKINERKAEQERKVAERRAKAANEAGDKRLASEQAKRAAEAKKAVGYAAKQAEKDAIKVKKELRTHFEKGGGVRDAKAVAKEARTTPAVKPKKLEGAHITDYVVQASTLMLRFFNSRAKDKSKVEQKCVDTIKAAKKFRQLCETSTYENFIKNIRDCANRLNAIADDLEKS